MRKSLKHYTILYDWNNNSSKSLVEKDTDGTYNDSETVEIDLNRKANVKWASSNMNILKIGKTYTPEIGDDGYNYFADIVFVNFGTANVFAYINGKKYTILVTFKPSAVYDAAKKVISDTIKPDMDDAHKAYAIANWMMNNCKYDIECKHEASSLEFIFLEHRGVCGDYSTAYSFILINYPLKIVL